ESQDTTTLNAKKNPGPGKHPRDYQRTTANASEDSEHRRTTVNISVSHFSIYQSPGTTEPVIST
ncbi:MAG TPA: hypothetical protein VHS80_09965, partial [Chthoniobacterales bacterium]|nr:hypothetical protein [Chthoniobacterales bacterium]